MRGAEAVAQACLLEAWDALGGAECLGAWMRQKNHKPRESSQAGHGRLPVATTNTPKTGWPTRDRHGDFSLAQTPVASQGAAQAAWSGGGVRGTGGTSFPSCPEAAPA